MNASPPLIVVVAPVFRIAKHFCKHQHNPPLNPMSSDVVIITQLSDVYRLRGRGDRQIKLWIVGNHQDLRPDVVAAVRKALPDQEVLVGDG